MDIGDEAENVTPITLQELEQKLLIEIRNNGLQDVEVQSMLHDCILASNKVAMRLLAKGREDASLECLKKAELLAGPSTLGDLAQSQDVIALRILTQNNLACWHRQRGQLETALAFLRSAEALSGTSKETPQRPRSPKVNDYLNPLNSDDEDSEATTQRTEASCQQVAVTHSNLCAILSELGHHAEALGHAKKAVLFCKQELRMVMKRHPAEHQFEDYSSRGGTTVSRGGTTVTPMPPKPVLKTLAALAIACYNMAVEMEFTEGKNCLQWYERSMKLAEDARAQEDVLSRIRRSLRLAQKKWLKKKRISSSSARSPNQEDHFPASPIKKEGFGVDNGQNYFYNGPSNTSIKDSDSSSAPSTHRGRRATLGYESRPRKPFQKKKQQPPNYRKGTESAGRKLKKSTWESKTEGDLSKAINKQSPLKQHHSDTAIGTKQRSPVLTLQQQIREMEKLTSSAKRAIREVYRNDAFQSAATTIQAHARGYIQRKGFVTKQGRQPNGNYSFSTSGETKLYGKSSGDINLTKAREEVAALQMQVGNLEAGLTLVREQRGEALELLQIKSARIQELVDSLQEAESDKDTLKEEINTLKEKLAESASKIDHLNIAFEAEKEKFKTLAAENEGVLKMSAAQSQEWSQMLSITQQEVTKLREEIGSEKQDKLMLIEKQAEVKQLEIQINSLETQMALKVKEKDQEIEEFKERASALQQEVEELKAEHLQIEENQEEKFNSLQVALSSEQERLLEEVSCNRKLTTALSDLQEEQKKAHFFSQEIERQMADLKQAKNALEKDQQSLKDQIQILEKEKQDALNQVATLEQGNNELKSKLKEQTQESAKESETKLDNLKIEMDKKWGAKIQSQTSNFQKDLSEQEQKNSCLEETNKALADEVSKLQKSVTRQKDLEAEVASMSEQLTQAQGDNEVFLNQISELKAKLNEMLASKETELRNFIDVQERNVQHQNEIEQKGTIIDAVAKEKETLEKKIDKINEELTRAKLENGELSKKNSDLADNLKKLRDENDLIRKEMQGLRASGTFDYLTNEEMDGMKDLLGVSEKAGMEAGKVLKEMLQTYKKSLATIAELEDLLKQSDDKLNIAEMNIQQLERTIGCLKLREAIDILNKKGTTASDTDANAQKDAMMKMLEDAQNIGDSNMQLANKMASMYSDSQIEIQKLKREVDLLRAEGKDDTITNLDSLMTTLIPAKSAEPDAPNNQSNNEDLVDDTQNSDVSLTRQLSSTRGKLRIATKAKETYKLKYEQSQRELLELKQSPGLGNNENACISEQKSNNFPPNSSGGLSSNQES